MSCELMCTCLPGWNVAGTKQEVIEQRLASMFGMTIHEIHVLLDLLERTLDVVLDTPDNQRDEDHGEAARMMAAESGRTEGWIRNFLDSWEFVSDGVENEARRPWGGLPPMGTNPRLKTNQEKEKP